MQTQTQDSAPRDALVAILPEIDAARPTLGLATPERQRLRMIEWIARARALADVVGDRAADERVHTIARTLQVLGQTWWPGSVLALARTTPPQRVFPGTSVRTWEAVAEEAKVRGERAVNWVDDGACAPRPHDVDAMFGGARGVLAELGGPLGGAAPLEAVVVVAKRRLSELVRIAAELRWLRGAVPALDWAAGIGRLRGLARALGRDGAPITAVLDPAFAPSSWARHLGRDPGREEVLGCMPGGDAEPETLVAWLLRAFGVFDNPALVELCRPLRPKILALQPELSTRRDRRRLAALQEGLAASTVIVKPVATQAARPTPRRVEPMLVQQARALFHGQRALFISNRSFPELEARLDEELGVTCEVAASVDSPRRRQALLSRIRSGTYDLVLVAHEFSGHADTEQFADACKSSGVRYFAVGKGRFNRVVSRLLAASQQNVPPHAA